MQTVLKTSTEQSTFRDPNAFKGYVHDFEELSSQNENARKFYIESYGCSMNFADSEIVASVLSVAGFVPTRNIEDADLILINTCSIREKAEETVRKRLKEFNKVKKYKPGTIVGVLGCMAERLKEKFLEEEKIVDIVIGPDAYRDLPMLVDTAELGEKGINVFLSREETYADISPLRLGSNGISAYISIMRGCDNMCSFCVVPFTRGRERSRDLYSILAEVKDLEQNNYKEITLLGQNVDSYKWENPENKEVVNFATLLRFVAESAPKVRIRFSTSHPKDITDEVLKTISSHNNICKYIHLPVQSGNSRILKMMNRTYDSVWYKERVDAIRRIIPDCAISSDIIVGFCSETEEEFQDTLDVIRYSNYTLCYMYHYSERPGTLAAKKYPDDISDEVKQRRLSETIVVQRQNSYENNLLDVGKTFEVLIEGDSKKSNQQFAGRNSQNKVIVFRKSGDYKPGDFVMVKVTEVTSGTLLGKLIS
jgi:tRNA-2-methylthio-N6-dimethylallyladenosine synthase